MNSVIKVFNIKVQLIKIQLIKIIKNILKESN